MQYCTFHRISASAKLCTVIALQFLKKYANIYKSKKNNFTYIFKFRQINSYTWKYSFFSRKKYKYILQTFLQNFYVRFLQQQFEKKSSNNLRKKLATAWRQIENCLKLLLLVILFERDFEISSSTSVRQGRV